MRLAVIDDDPLYLTVLHDLLGQWNPDFYDSGDKFLGVDYGIYDLAIIDHSIDGKDWRHVYEKARHNSKTDFIIIATFDLKHYNNPPILTKEEKKDSRISGVFRRYDREKLKEWVKLWETFNKPQKLKTT